MLLVIEIIFWITIIVSLLLGYYIFRDVADVTQFWLKSYRENVMKTWYRRHLYFWGSLMALMGAFYLHYEYEVGVLSIAWITTSLWLIFILGGYFNPGWMMRTQQKTGRFVSVDEAKSFIHRNYEVLVIEHNGEARAHTDYELWRPHVVGTPEGLGGENIVMSYCAMTNLGMAFKPEIEGKPVELKVMTQLENNLVMWDKNSGEPIQQIWGTKECDGRFGSAMQQYPLFKMPFEKFAKAYPKGQVFHRRRVLMKENPLVAMYDKFWESQFYMAVSRQKQESAPIFPTLSHIDNRLYPKEPVWGFNIDDDYVCYSLPYIQEQTKPLNVVVGDRNIIIHWDEEYECLGIWYNDFNEPVSTMDFWGQSDLGKHKRVEQVKAGIFYAMWVNFYPETGVNRAE